MRFDAKEDEQKPEERKYIARYRDVMSYNVMSCHVKFRCSLIPQ